MAKTRAGILAAGRAKGRPAWQAEIARRKAGGKKPAIGFTVDGMPQLTEKLREFDINLQKKAMRLATKEAAQAVLHMARAMAPVDTGNLAASLKVRAKAKGRRGNKEVGHSVVSIGQKASSGKNTYYAAAVEFGTERMAARPFMRPAARKAKPQADRIFRRKLIEAVAEIATHGRVLTIKERKAAAT